MTFNAADSCEKRKRERQYSLRYNARPRSRKMIEIFVSSLEGGAIQFSVIDCPLSNLFQLHLIAPVWKLQAEVVLEMKRKEKMPEWK